MVLGKVHLTGNYARYRIRTPSRFDKSSFRTLPAGKWAKGKAKEIRGPLKKSGKWHTQAVLLNRTAYDKGYRVSHKRGVYKLKKVK